MRISVFFAFLAIMLSCEKNNVVSNDGLPFGLERIESSAGNECSQPACSEERKLRFKANGVKVKIHVTTGGEFIAIHNFGIDGRLDFYFCDLPERFQSNNLWIRFSGKVVDACGIKRPVLGGQQTFFVLLDDIVKAN